MLELLIGFVIGGYIGYVTGWNAALEKASVAILKALKDRGIT